jgi:Uma2 family endonuclease
MTALREDELWISPEAYLEGEKVAPIKYEYVEGRVFAMAGASADHNIIAGNIFAELRAQLRGKRCTPFISDMKVKIPPIGPNYELTFYYPDVVVACGEKEPDPYYREEPEVIFEVLSPSTASTDLREKRAAYLRIPSIEGFITMAQEQMEAIVYRRAGRNFEMMRGPVRRTRSSSAPSTAS